MTQMVPESVVPKSQLTVSGQTWELVVTLEDRGYIGVGFCITDPMAEPVTTTVPMHRAHDAWQFLVHAVALRTGLRKNAAAEFKLSRDFAQQCGHDVTKW